MKTVDTSSLKLQKGISFLKRGDTDPLVESTIVFNSHPPQFYEQKGYYVLNGFRQQDRPPEDEIDQYEVAMGAVTREAIGPALRDRPELRSVILEPRGMFTWAMKQAGFSAHDIKRAWNEINQNIHIDATDDLPPAYRE